MSRDGSGQAASGNKTVLVVDDDRDIVRLVRAYLLEAGYRVVVAHDGRSAVTEVHASRPDLVVLDLMLPDRDGWDVTRELRSDERVASVPIIMLTARVEDSDKVVGLELGADDYVTKPFNPRELVARVRAVLRRGAGVARVAECFRSGDLSLDVSRHEVRCGGKMIDVTPTEFRLLETMLQAPGCAFTRTELIERALGYDYEGLERTLDSHIKNLRRKVEPDPRRPKYIHTVYGVGYRVEAPDHRRGTEA